MHKFARCYILVFIAAVLLGSCSKVPDNARYIPADAVAIVGINIRSLGKKIAWNLITGSKLFKEIQKRMPDKKAGDAMGGIENAGFDVANTFYVYTVPDTRFRSGNLLAGLLPLADAARWEAYVKQVFPAAAIQQRAGRKEAALGAGMYVGWTPELLIIINAETKNRANEEDDREEVAENADEDLTIVLAEMDKAFAVPAGKPITENKRFSGFEGHGYDLSLWLNYGSLVSSYTEGMNMDVNGITLSSATWKDAILTLGFNFKKGKITGDISYYLPSLVAEATKDFGEVEANKDMLDRLPDNSLDMLFSMHVSPKGIKAILEKTGLFGITNVGLATQGLDVDYVLDAFTGDMAVAMNDFSLSTETLTDEFMGQMVAHKQQKAAMSMTYVVKINNKENFARLLDMTAGTQMQPVANGYVLPLTTKDSIHLLLNNEYAVVSNKHEYATGFLGGAYTRGKMPAHIAKKAYGYPFAFCLDVKQMFNNVDPAISSSPRDSAIIAESKKLIDNISVNGGKYIDDAYKFKLEIDFINTDENSILEIIDFGMRMNDINNNTDM